MTPKVDSPRASLLGETKRDDQRAHTLQAPRRERWRDTPEDFGAEMPEDELKTILLSIRPCLPHQQLAEANGNATTPSASTWWQ